ncbi:ATP-dependent nuclease, partial [Lacticaseibacillus rhamnosus]
PAITPEAAYTPTSNRGGSRSAKKSHQREKTHLTASLKF